MIATSVLAWGDNASGQLGLPASDGTDLPVPVDSLAGIRSISPGSGHVLAVLPDGRVMGWGRNVFGQTGGSVGGVAPPHVVDGLEDVVAVAAGGGHSIALDADGRVWAWGAGFFGSMATAGEQVHPRPTLIPELRGIVSITAGGSHNVAIDAEGRAFTWGRDDHGQLGDPGRVHTEGRRMVEYSGATFDCRFVPALVEGVGPLRTAVAGGGHVLALDADGTLVSWGFNDRGQLGHSDTKDDPAPRPLAGAPEVVSFGAGYHHTLLALADGTVAACGLNDGGQLGDGSTTNHSELVAVPGLSGIVQVAAAGGGSDLAPGGAGHSMARAADGTLWHWGFVRTRPGRGDERFELRPTPVPLPGPAASVAAGGEIPVLSRRATEGDYAEDPSGGAAFAILAASGPAARR